MVLFDLEATKLTTRLFYNLQLNENLKIFKNKTIQYIFEFLAFFNNSGTILIISVLSGRTFPFWYVLHFQGPRMGKLLPHPSVTEKNCRKMVLFSRGVENAKDPGRWDSNWVKGQFSIEIFVCKC